MNNPKYKTNYSRVRMKSKVFVIISIICVFFVRSFCHADEKNAISQFGITWTFDKDYTVGQFANGDYWVIGPVKIIGINPPSTKIDGRVKNGSMINPSPTLGITHGYDSTLFGRYAKPEYYDPALNAARPNDNDLSESNPLIVQPNSSLVSTISVEEPGHRPQLQTAAILTVLDVPAPEGSFRPAYCGNNKTIRFNKDQLNYSMLASLKPVPNTPSLTTVERGFERPWIDHIPGWMTDYHHPINNMPFYGREVSTLIGEGALMLHLNFTEQDKETLFIRYVQLGIDLFGILQDSGKDNWVNNGGIAGGRKWPIMFAGLVLDCNDMINVGDKSGDYLYSNGYGPGNEPPDYIHFGEDDQTFYVGDGDIYTPPYVEHRNSDGFTYYGHGNGGKHRDYIEYQEHHRGLPEWGINHTTKPNVDGLDWDSSYRQVTANAWGGFVLAVHIMGVKDLWNHDALFDYKDRYAQVEVDQRERSRFVESMWDAYRPEYGPVWTMSPRLTVTAVNGSVTKHPDATVFIMGERVVLSVLADPGYEFAGWSGDLSGSDTPVTVIMHSDRSIIANFVEVKSK